MPTYQFIISSLQPLVNDKVTCLMGKVELKAGDKGESHTIANYFDEVVEKKKFVFSWNPSEKFKSTFTSIKSNPKSKEKKGKTFNLTLATRLLEDGKVIWSRNLTFTNAWVKDTPPDGRTTGGQFVHIEFESAVPSKPVHH